ncbi:2-C-methyl-D-erythritol 4-phosphate cytidylyltransferase [Amycolatopsis sp. 195334CR]|uniref:IspD/TarI family cytidylyltransferase n=1 Tax=Amycolatopsis sp. 195334CR TaxID=2814588 RepID=UPI001A904A70|nr:2-C-methyl-D-erythritol 4-phosphate cytidylyltransferase [Amycolatopsis sp. 195334CR]MBN6035044.1 2-C-methyl-D-erythritol 4-phosphate cytidylyltransferase [Amycolatopsis sp. 195334CR]
MKHVALLVADTSQGALASLRGEALLTHAVRGLIDSGCEDLTIVLDSDRRLAESESAVRVVPGAVQRYRVFSGCADRSESLRGALHVVAPTRSEVLVVHEATRARTPASLVRAVVAAVRDGAPAAVPVLPMTDTVKLVDHTARITGTSDRTRLRTLQTPMAFHPDLRDELAEHGPEGLLDRLGAAVRLVDGHPDAARLASGFELALAEAALAEAGGKR